MHRLPVCYDYKTCLPDQDPPDPPIRINWSNGALQHHQLSVFSTSWYRSWLIKKQERITAGACPYSAVGHASDGGKREGRAHLSPDTLKSKSMLDFLGDMEELNG